MSYNVLHDNDIITPDIVLCMYVLPVRNWKRGLMILTNGGHIG